MPDGLTSDTCAEDLGIALPARLRRFVDEEREEHDGKQARLPHYADPVEVWFVGRHEDESVLPVADSLDAFLASLAAATRDDG